MSQPAARLDALEAEVADLRAALMAAGVEVRPRRLARRRKRCMVCGLPLPSPSPHRGRRDRRTCSGACRTRAWLERGPRLDRLEAEVADLRAALGRQAEGVSAMIADPDVPTPAPSPSPAPLAAVVRDETLPGRCVVCGRPLGPPRGPGRPRRTCSNACRQAAHRRRDRGLPESMPLALRRGRRPLAGLLADNSS